MKISILSINLKTAMKRSFSRRAEAVNEMIRIYDPDIVCVRSLEEYMLRELAPLTQTYRFYGGGAAVGKRTLRTCILYRRDLFRLENGSTYFVKNSPLRLPGTVTAGTLVHEGVQLNVVCMSLNRPSGGFAEKLLAARMEEDNLVVCGDVQVQGLHSVRTQETAVKRFVRSAASPYRREECICTSEKLPVLHSEALGSLFMGTFPSDGIPVYAELEL
ncbi:MAG: hypothetical protein IJH98_04390 [Solobacterium sp.]|nr:hypothetical protein [Solobacterium sp.]